MTLSGTWIGHISGDNRGALTLSLTVNNGQISGEFILDDSTFGRSVALIEGSIRDGKIEGELSNFRGAPGQMVPSKGHISGTVRPKEDEIEGEWESDANRRGHFFVLKDATAVQPPLPTNQPTTWESEVKNSTIAAFQMPLADLKEIVSLFANAAREAREKHGTWLNQYWHGQPPPAAITGIPNATIEITQGETFTVMSDLAAFDPAKIGPDVKTFCLYSYKQGAPVVPSHGVQVLLTGINGTSNASGIINVHGLELNWARGVLSTFADFFGRRRVRRTWLHNPRAQQFVPFIAGIWMLCLLFLLVPVMPDSLLKFQVIAFGVALYLFLIINFSFNALLGFARHAYPLYEIQFPEQAPFQKRRRMVWTIVSAVGLAIVGTVAADVILSVIRELF
jgi:hypothetical protein